MCGRNETFVDLSSKAGSAQLGQLLSTVKTCLTESSGTIIMNKWVDAYNLSRDQSAIPWRKQHEIRRPRYSTLCPCFVLARETRLKEAQNALREKRLVSRLASRLPDGSPSLISTPWTIQNTKSATSVSPTPIHVNNFSKALSNRSPP